MKIANKTLWEYFETSKKFLAIIFALTVISISWRLFYSYPPLIQNLGGLLVGIVAGWAGWAAVSNCRFNLKQVGLVGIFLPFATHWTLPIFHSAWEILILIIINTTIFSVATVLGGWLAKKFKK